MNKKLFFLMVSALLLCLIACEQEHNGSPESSYLKLTTQASSMISTQSNAEIVRVVQESGLILLLDSKKGQLINYSWDGSKLKQGANERSLLPPAGENEITSSAIVSSKVLAVTQTVIKSDSQGKQIDCAGKLLFVNIEIGPNFGTIISSVDVGAMPDAVAISEDAQWAVTADERDGPDAWGKCTVADKHPSISIVSLKDGVESAKVISTIELSTNGENMPREPEYVAIANDNDSVAVTLQDSHEVAMFKISQTVTKGAKLKEDAINIISLPKNAQGAAPWPDGIIHISVNNKSYYVVAGEWNDCLITLDASGQLVSNMPIEARYVPSNYPYAEAANTPRYSPDSLFAFKRDNKQYVAATLRHAGAVIVYNYDSPSAPVFAGIAKVGAQEKGKVDEDGSTVRPEGISGAADGRFLVTANEGEGSLSYIQVQ